MKNAKKEFLVRIIYKSGAMQEFWVKSFECDGLKYKWTSADPIIRPLLLGPEEIAAIWQIDAREGEK